MKDRCIDSHDVPDADLQLVRMAEHHQIVADGRQRLRATEQHRRKEREVREAVARRYEPEFAAAGSIRYLILLLKMWRELRRKLDTLTSERSLYLNSPS